MAKRKNLRDKKIKVAYLWGFWGETFFLIKKFLKKREPIKSFRIYLSATCNLKCKYCWNRQGSFSRNSMFPPFMDYRTAEETIQFIIKTAQKDAHITFFGGEPFLNLEVMKMILDGLESKKDVKFTYSVETNGTIYNEEIERVLTSHSIDVCVSMDGPREIHNKYRIFPDNKGSFDLIYKNIKRMMDRGIEPLISSNIRDMDIEIREVYRYLQQEFKKVTARYVLFERFPGEKIRVVRGEDFIDKFKEQYRLLYDYAISKIQQNKDGGIPELRADLNRLLKPQLNGFGLCDAALGRWVDISTNGEIYPCYTLMIPLMKIGDVKEGVNLNSWWFKKTRGYWIRKYKERCQGCWALYHCDNICPAINIVFNNTPDIPVEIFCKIRKIQSELFGYLLVKLNKAGIDPENLLENLEGNSKDLLIISAEKRSSL